MPRRPRLAIASYAKRPRLRSDDLLLATALEGEGIEPCPVVWDDESVAWDEFDACLIRSTSDYHLKYERFLAWLEAIDGVLPIWNPIDMVVWNADKTHLRELEEAGVPIVPTYWLPQHGALRLDQVLASMGWKQAILKPTVGLGAERLRRVQIGDDDCQEALEGLAAHGGVMVQPFLSSVESHGETSLVFVDGELTHTVHKRPAAGDFRVQPRWGGTMATADPTPAALDLAERVLAQLPTRPLFARIDLVPSPEGKPLLIELELVEPVLFFEQGPAAATRLARAIRRDERLG